MATISRRAIEWMQEESEAKDNLISDLEDELEAALADLAAALAQLRREKATPED